MTSTPICALSSGQAYCGVGDTLARTSGMTLSSSARLNKGSRNTASVVVISHLYPPRKSLGAGVKEWPGRRRRYRWQPDGFEIALLRLNCQIGRLHGIICRKDR